MDRVNIGKVLFDQVIALLFVFSIIFAFYKNYRLHAYYGIDLDISYFKLTHFIFFNSVFIGIFSYFSKKNLTLAGMIMYFLVVAPINAYYVTANQSSSFFFSVNTSYLIFLAIIVFLPSLKVLSIEKNQAYIIFTTFVFFIIVSVFGYLFLSKGLPSFGLLTDINSVYTFRSEYSQPAIIEYLKSFLVYAVIPIISLFFIENKKYILASLFIFLNILIYLYTGSRFIFVLTFFIVPFFILIKINNPTRVSMIALILLFLLSGFLTDTDYYYISHFIFFRPIEIPAWLSFVYHDFFIVDGLYYYSESFEILNFENKNPAPRVIGDLLFPDDGTTWANVGFFGHAFYNLSYIGILINSILAGLIFWITYVITPGVKNVTIVTIMLYCYYLANFGLLTMIFNRGFVAAIALLVLLNSLNKIEIKL